MRKIAIALALAAPIVALTAGFDTTLRIVADVLPMSITRVTPGPMASYLSTYPAFLEFQRSGWGLAKGSIGGLGSPEMNISFNMDYSTGYHRPYDPSIAANWWTINAAGYFCQYMPPNPPPGTGSAWDATGNQLLCAITPAGSTFKGTLRADALVLNKASGRVTIPAGQASIVVRNASVKPSSNIFTSGPAPSTATAGEGAFRIDLDAPAMVDVTVGYLILAAE